MKSKEELKKELNEICERTDTRVSGVEHFIKFYMSSLHWTEKKAIEYTIGLFKDGTIQQIKVIGKDGEIL